MSWSKDHSYFADSLSLWQEQRVINGQGFGRRRALPTASALPPVLASDSLNERIRGSGLVFKFNQLHYFVVSS